MDAEYSQMAPPAAERPSTSAATSALTVVSALVGLLLAVTAMIALPHTLVRARRNTIRTGNACTL